MRPMGENFAAWLKPRREATGLSVRRFATATGTTPSTISLMERGLLRPSLDLQARLADALGVTLDDVTIATFPDEYSDRDIRLLRRWLCEACQISPCAPGDTAPPQPE